MKKLLLSMAAVALGFSAFSGEVVFDFTANNYGLTPYDEDLGNNTPYIETPATVTQEDVTITLNGETSSDATAWRMWSDGLREYYKRNPSFTVSTTNGEKVTGVEWTVVSGATFALEGTEENITYWVGEENEVTFVGTASANKAIKTIKVTYGDTTLDVPETPDNTDKPDNTEKPDAPQGTISVAEAITLMDAGYTGEATVKGIVTGEPSFNEQYGDMNYYIKDENSDATLYVYNGYGLNNDKFEDVSDLPVGAVVVVTGQLTVYNDIYEFARGNYLLSIDGESGSENPGEPEGVIFKENFATSLGDFTIDDIELPEELTYVWSFASGYGAKASAYLNSTNYAARSVLISPVIDLTNYTDVTFNFDQAVNYANGNDVDMLCIVMVREAGQEEDWDILSNVNYPEGSNWTFVNSGELSLKDYEGKKIELGFYYNSTEAAAPTWEIKNLVVNGTESAGVQAIEFDSNAPIEYYNLSGVRVNNPAKGGLYIMRQGNKSKKVLVR